MHCPTGREYTFRASDPQVLEGYLDEANSYIKRTLFSKARSPCSGAIKSLKTRTPFGIVTRNVPSEKRILELSEQDWYLNAPRRWHQARGLQYPLCDKILLKTKNWCRETILHEALHRFSIFVSDLELRKRYPIFEDGITEFFVGFVLFKDYPDCYSNWRTKSFKACSMTYPWSVMRFYAFCNFVSIKSLIDLYFWQPGRSWEKAWSDFVSNIRNSGYPSFRDIIELYSWAEPTEYFFEECKEKFGSKFRRLYSSRIDYSTIKI